MDMASARERADARIWDRIDKGAPGGCWLWFGMTDDDGYGRLKRDGRNVRAHRYIYEMLREAIPQGLQIDHLCRVRNCVNPDHLEPVTTRENVARGMANWAITQRTNHCMRGHEYTPENTMLRPDRPSNRYCKKCIAIYMRGYHQRRKARERAA